MKVTLKHTKLNTLKTVKVGFSWTTLFFGIFAIPFREHGFKETLRYFLLCLVTCGFWQPIEWFFGNKFYIKRLIASGEYVPASEYDKNALINKKVIG